MEEYKTYCWSCGTANPNTSSFCSHCGAELLKVAAEDQSELVVKVPEKGLTHCPNCGAEAILGKPFCWQCGSNLKTGQIASASIAKSVPRKKNRLSVSSIFFTWWPLLFIVMGILMFGRADEHEYDFELKSGSVALVYVGLVAIWFKGIQARWLHVHDRIKKSQDEIQSTPNPKTTRGGAQNCARRLASVLFVLLLTLFIFVGVAEEITPDDIPNDILRGFAYILLKPTDWIENGLEKIDEIGTSRFLPSISIGGLGCPSYNWSSSGEDCYVDSHGMRMCTGGTAGAPSASDCWRDGSTHICQDSNGNIINMSRLCEQYPCTPLCKTLGIK